MVLPAKVHPVKALLLVLTEVKPGRREDLRADPLLAPLLGLPLVLVRVVPKLHQLPELGLLPPQGLTTLKVLLLLGLEELHPLVLHPLVVLLPLVLLPLVLLAHLIRVKVS